MVDMLRRRSEGRPIGIKIAAGNIERDLEYCVYARPDFITIDGRGGATGSSPLMLREATTVPTIYALSRARKYLDSVGSDISLVITGGLRVSADFVKARLQSRPCFKDGIQTVKKASQSLRPQAQIKFKAFLPAACTSAKILLGSQTCERKRVRCGEPQPFQTRAQRSGSRLRACQKCFFDTLKREVKLTSLF